MHANRLLTDRNSRNANAAQKLQTNTNTVIDVPSEMKSQETRKREKYTFQFDIDERCSLCAIRPFSNCSFVVMKCVQSHHKFFVVVVICRLFCAVAKKKKIFVLHAKFFLFKFV